jgi:hypothetical protein
MDQEERSLLEENLRMSRENNKLLIKVRSSQRWASITRVLYWMVLIGISFGAFYFLQPYIEKIMNLYSRLPN